MKRIYDIYGVLRLFSNLMDKRPVPGLCNASFRGKSGEGPDEN